MFFLRHHSLLNEKGGSIVVYRLTNYVIVVDIVVDNPPNFLVNFVGNKHLMTGPEGNS